jgi:hypothetical protein
MVLPQKWQRLSEVIVLVFVLLSGFAIIGGSKS